MKEIQQNQTEFYKKVISDLNNLGYKNTSSDSIAFMVENDSDDIGVDINFMSAGLHYSKKNISEQDVIEAGFKWCSTWNYYEK